MRLHRPPSTSLPSYLLSQIQSCLLPLLSIHGPEQRGGRDCSVAARGSGARSQRRGVGVARERRGVARHGCGRGGSVVVRGGGARSQWRSRWRCLTAAAEHTSRRSSGDNGGKGVVAGCGMGWGRWRRRDTSAAATMTTRLLRLLQGRSGIRRLHRRRWRQGGGSASGTQGPGRRLRVRQETAPRNDGSTRLARGLGGPRWLGLRPAQLDDDSGGPRLGLMDFEFGTWIWGF